MMALDPRWLGAEGIKPTQLAGWIGLAGAYDFLPIENPDVKPVFFHPNSPPESQPIRYVSRAAPRTFLGAAPEDDLINPERNTRQMASRLQAAGVGRPAVLSAHESPHADRRLCRAAAISGAGTG